MYLHNDTSMVTPPYELKLPGCADPCPLEQWLDITGRVVPDDWVEECKSTSGPYDFHVNAATVAGEFFNAFFQTLISGMIFLHIIL